VPGDDFGRGAPGTPALGRGPNRPARVSQENERAPTAGWGAARSVVRVLGRTREPVKGPQAIVKMNHENSGFDCPGCAWPDDRKGLHLDICENGIKHVTWEMTRQKVDREFFAAHTITELSGWTDFALEDQGRLIEPMAYDAASDKYASISWEDAFVTSNASRHIAIRSSAIESYPSNLWRRSQFSETCGRTRPGGRSSTS
jgi:anaerobic selenocysteine-containing dehydrogenase